MDLVFGCRLETHRSQMFQWVGLGRRRWGLVPEDLSENRGREGGREGGAEGGRERGRKELR